MIGYMMRYTQSYIDGLDLAISNLDFGGIARRSILVTGASGLIGSALCDLLLRADERGKLGLTLYLCGRSVEKLESRFSYWGNGRWNAVRYEAMEPLEFDFHVDYIFHCASNAHPKAYVDFPVETIFSNVVGTANLLAYAKETSASRVLYVSSSEVYGSRDSDAPYKEDDSYPINPLDPRSCYPNSKRVCETLCAAYAAEYGVKYVVARPGHVYGPTATAGDSRAHAQFARQAAAGNDIVIKSAGDQLRSYMHGTDCAAALMRIMLKGAPGEAYNVGDPGFVCTIRQLAEAFADAGGVSVVNAFPSERESSGFNRMSCSALDCSKLEALGFKRMYSLRDGVASCIEGLR